MVEKVNNDLTYIVQHKTNNKTKKQKFLKNAAFIFSKQWCVWFHVFYVQVPKTVKLFRFINTTSKVYKYFTQLSYLNIN